MEFKEVEELVNELVDSIAITPAGLSQSRERAANFLMGQAVLLSSLKDTDEELAKQVTLKDALYANTLNSVDGANVTEKKIMVLKEPDYATAREKYEELEAKRSWIKGHISIFENAHILYRSLSREN